MNKIRTRLTLAAGAVIIALTAAAFWLSYAHLHDVAATYGLGGSPARAWAWPATLDLFIVAGEIMMLVAALHKRRDLWAIGLTVAGSVGSIALNVFGVGSGADPIQYVVAAVPPSAALLAFGALMRQVHSAIAEPAQAVQEAAQAPVQEPAVTESVQDVVNELEALEDAAQAPEEDDQEEDQEEEVPVFTVSTKPTMRDIAAAVADLERDGTSLSGKALAQYFGVSDRTGRRYLIDWKAAQEVAA